MSRDNGASLLFDSVQANRKPPRGSGSPGGPVADDADLFPNVLAVLSALPKGAPKNAKLGRIAFYLYNGRISVAVNIPSMRTCGFYTLEGLLDAFQRLEGALAGGKVEWREDK